MSDNRANQLNPNNDLYWQARGYEKRPNNWKQLVVNAADTSKVSDKGTTSKKRKRNKKGRVGPLEWDDFGLLPADGYGRLSAEDY